MLRTAALILFVAFQDPVPTSMTFVAPKDAKPADVEKAARAIEKRCLEFGYKGVTAKVAGTEIHVSCATGITSVMEPNILKLAAHGYLYQIRFKPQLTDRELDQLEPGGVTPKGTEWVTMADGKLILLLIEPTVNVTGRMKWVGKVESEVENKERDVHFGQQSADMFFGPFGEYFEFDADLSKWAAKLTKAHEQNMVLLFDGYKLDTSGPGLTITPKRMGSRARWNAVAASEGPYTIFGVRINNPLPFALELKK